MPSERQFTPDQEHAISAHGRDLLVSAAAGSGKTAVLTERVIRELTGTNPDQRRTGIDRMLITTFTVAAAGELRSRIAEALGKQIAKTPDDADLIHQLMLLNSAHISTIDALFLDIVRAHFEKLGLNPSFRIGDEADLSPMELRAMRNAVNALYARHSTRQNTPDDPFGKVEDNPFSLFMDSMLSGREDSDLFPSLIRFRAVFSDEPEDLDLLKTCASRLQDELDHYTFFDTADGRVFRTKMQETFRHFKTAYADYLNRFDAPDGSHLKTAYGPAFQSDLRAVQGMLDLLENEATSFDEISAFLSGITFEKLGSRSAKDPAYSAAAKDTRDLYKKTVQALQKAYAGITDDQIRKDLGTVILHCEYLAELYAEYDALLNKDKNTFGIYSFTDVTRLALNLLAGEDGGPSEIARHIQESYDSLCIDEYQDVSPIQDRIFGLLGAGHRFMVGDIKQSIYRFRGAEPSLFNTYRNSMVPYGSPSDSGTEPACLFLSDNFRSDPPVLQVTNRICGTLFRTADGTVTYSPEDDLRTPASKPETQALPVRICVLPNGPQSEARKWDNLFLVQTVRELLLRHPPKDILILLQTNNQVAEIRRLLSKAGLPINPAHASLSQDRTMRSLLNLLSVIDNPHDDDSLFEVLQESPFDMSGDDLLLIRSREELRFSLWDSVKSHPERSADAADPVVQKCRMAVSLINELRDLCSVQSADQVLQSLCHHKEFRFLARTRAMTFIRDTTHRLQQNGFCPLHTALPYLIKTVAGRKAPAELSDSYINIMTIHKSKGLQAKVVIVPRMDADLISRRPSGIDLFFDRHQGLALPIREPGSPSSRKSFHELIVQSRYEDALKEEKIRLLYVAMTRAEQELILCGKKSEAPNAVDPVRQSPLDRFLLFNGNTYFDWILPALMHPAKEAGPAPEGSYKLEVPDVEESADPEGPSTSATGSGLDIRPASELCRNSQKILQAWDAGHYAQSALAGIPTHVAASKISPDFLDTLRDDGDPDLESANLEKRLELLTNQSQTFSQMLSESRRVTAAEKGTLTHLFLQFVDFRKLDETSVEQQILELTELGFINEVQASRMYRPFLKKFVSSDLFQSLLKGRNIFREYEFALNADLSRFTKDPEYAKKLASLPDHSIQIRGSIDLLFEDETGKLCLVDYKTDAIPSGLETEADIRSYLLDKHRTQLQIYAQAVTSIFGRRPDRIGIFSFVSGRLYELGTDLENLFPNPTN